MSEGSGMGEGEPEAQGEVDHPVLLAHDLGPVRESTEVVVRVRVVLLNGNGMGFADLMPFGRQYAGESLPDIREKATGCQVLDFGVKLSEDVSITIAHHPGDTSPCATIQRLDDPSLVFLNR